ncbi:Lrp/AsnC family transcriptional regulator [Amycolatopsis sp. EV170708-02-1]|uniref:Lrp/AsnC family transcriptional regulator n=1 Tax=Amycolatopsis sp. EV170708-02-1 TaxID=2919322 RepID=UPI001F0BBF77|nr:AsnC family transcriptional regulator [Amycolatopsis sp. EV170708-02-1]UMP07545.1 Lrp/AsnC family transcriptional regulator [Amycolatopsis sp. EV170708-02-1]
MSTMPVDHPIDELDLALVDSLQISPRISWERLGRQLDVAPVTLARRWARLERSGYAWVIAWPGMRQWQLFSTALLQVRCAPSAVGAVATALAHLPYVATVEHTTGDYELFVIVVAPSLPTLSRLLIDPIPQDLPVLAVRTVVCGRLFGTISWRLGAIGDAQAAGIADDTPEPSAETARPFGPADRDLLLALAVDGRQRFVDLAARLGTTPQAVKRRLSTLQRSGDIAFRCDLARPLAGWPLLALLWLVVPDDQLSQVGHCLAAWTESRLCVQVVGNTNLVAAWGLRSVGELDELVARLARMARRPRSPTGKSCYSSSNSPAEYSTLTVAQCKPFRSTHGSWNDRDRESENPTSPDVPTPP